MTNGKLTVGRVNKSVPKTANIRVDRASALGNPYRMFKESQRDKVCDQYKEYFKEEVQNNEDMQTEIQHIYTLIKNGKNVNLQCWCAPKRCHADTIKEYIESRL